LGNNNNEFTSTGRYYRAINDFIIRNYNQNEFAFILTKFDKILRNLNDISLNEEQMIMYAKTCGSNLLGFLSNVGFITDTFTISYEVLFLSARRDQLISATQERAYNGFGRWCVSEFFRYIRA